MAFPKPTRIEGYKNVPLPYVFLADDAFALSERLLKPYPGVQKLSIYQRIFNYCLSSARIIVKNVFGIMASVFQI